MSFCEKSQWALQQSSSNLKQNEMSAIIAQNGESCGKSPLRVYAQKAPKGSHNRPQWDPVAKHISVHARKSSISLEAPALLQLDLDLARRYEVLGRQEQNDSTKHVSPSVKSRVNSLDNKFKHAGTFTPRWGSSLAGAPPPAIFVQTKFLGNRR